ncbi:MAG: FG-GAP repeat protein, partial [Deltaproteobacteria bacterium]|nr:FG-GAP repeat protein [Deltaproteobacteria bacterium]
AGAVNVIYGSATGLTATGNQIWDQDAPGIKGTAEQDDHFGAPLTVGDFNGDGKDDLAIGVPGEDVGSVNAAGAVNVIYGSATGLTATGNQIWDQDAPGIKGTAEEGDGFGGALASAGKSSSTSGGAGFSGAWQSLDQLCGGSNKIRCRLKGILEVFNPGILTARASVLHFFLSSDATLDETDPLLEEVKVRALAPQERIEVRLKIHLAREETASGSFVIAVLDATNVVSEVKEENNIVVSPQIP